MYLDQQNYHIAYSHIKQLSTTTTISIFVAHPDVDALCAAKILTSMFIADYIQFKLIPIQGYADLSRECSAQVNSKCFIFINCGGMVDLSQLISLEEVLIFILDNHRPLNLDNLFCGIDLEGNMAAETNGGAHIIVLDDGDCEHLGSERAAYFALLEDSDEDDYDDDDDNEDRAPESDIDNASDDLEKIEDESRLGEKEDSTDDDEATEPQSLYNSDDENMEPSENTNGDNLIGDDEDDDQEDVIIRKPSRKRTRSLSPSPTLKSGGLMKLRKDKRICETILREYYNLTFHGTPASSIMYTLSSQLSKDCNSNLWNALIGLSAQYLYNQTTMEEYLFHVELYKDEVKRFNPNNGSSGNNGEIESSKTGFTAVDADDNSIHYNQRELKLMLYRHWSLYDSMYHSSYVASKLGIWRERGKQKLRNLLAKMGFSLSQSHQHHYDCDLDLRRVMETRLEDTGVLYGLDDLTFESFIRCFGFKTVISTCDAVYALAALIELSPSLSQVLHLDLKRLGSSGRSNKQSNNKKNENDENEDILQEMDGFYMAFDALDNVKYLLKGIEMAQMLQKIVVKIGTQIIEERLVKTLKTFRLVVLKDSPDLSLFTHPLTLLRLALFMVEAMKQTGKSYLPFIIAALNKTSETYLVVGQSSGKSAFSEAFRKCADVTRASVKQDRFDCSIIEIAKNDLAKFMEHLQIFL